MIRETEKETAEGEFRLLFVCTGNTCRSPMAEAIARAESAARGWAGLAAASAGVAAASGLPASEGAISAAGRRGLDLTGHRSRPLTPELIDWADLILTMSPRHTLTAEAEGGAGKTVLLTTYSAGDAPGPSGGVPDPFGGNEAEYEATFQALERLVKRALARLEPILAP